MGELFISLLTAGIIVGLGLSVHLTLGYLRSKAQETPGKPVTFSKAKALSSLIVGSLTGLILVLPQIDKMQWNTEPINAIILAATLLGTVAGIDAIAKKSGQVVKSNLGG